MIMNFITESTYQHQTKVCPMPLKPRTLVLCLHYEHYA